MDRAPVPARFLRRENRFVVLARRDEDHRDVRAYLPNTARLPDLLTPGADLLLLPSSDARRRTGWTVTRVWDGTWVALDAAAANGLVVNHLAAGGKLPGWPTIHGLRREVRVGDHRFDLELTFEDTSRALVEVKSLSRVHRGVAPLSSTPSSRGVRHLEALAEHATTGWRVAVVFVVQRADARILDLDAVAEPRWIAAVRAARDAGVVVAAYRCDVEPAKLRLGEALVVRGG